MWTGLAQEPKPVVEQQLIVIKDFTSEIVHIYKIELTEGFQNSRHISIHNTAQN